MDVRQKQAKLASSMGAGILGIGAGVLVADALAAFAIALLIAGAILHGWGMTAKHRLESSGDVPAWSKVAYWACWAGLAALAAWIGFSLLA